jgi:large subunit ribosomal protein L32e
MSLIELKNKMKKKKPRFLRQDGHKLHLPQNWRRPRGMHNKMRMGKKGHGVKVDSGYRSPKEVRYMHFSNLNEIMITNMNEIKNVNPKTDGVILSKKLGLKKKILIVEECIKLNIKILNLTNPAKFIEESKKTKEKSKQENVEKEQKRKKTKEEILKKAEEKTEKSKDEKKEEEKQLEKEILTHEHVHQHKDHEMSHEKVSDRISKSDPVRTKIPSGGDRSV